jgi:DNA-binding XRE family transcriptional regulator
MTTTNPKQKLLERGRFVAKQIRGWSATRFKRERETLGLTQEELGKVLGLHEVQISRIENGHSPVQDGAALLLLVLSDRLKGRA